MTSEQHKMSTTGALLQYNTKQHNGNQKKKKHAKNLKQKPYIYGIHDCCDPKCEGLLRVLPQCNIKQHNGYQKIRGILLTKNPKQKSYLPSIHDCANPNCKGLLRHL